MMRSAPICLAERTPRSPTAPSPTTTTVLPGFHRRSVGSEPRGAHDVREPDNGVRGLGDPRDLAFFETHVSRTVENSSAHGLSPSLSVTEQLDRHIHGARAVEGLNAGFDPT